MQHAHGVWNMAQTITVHLRKPGKDTTITYQGVLLSADPDSLLVHARWERAPLDLGYVRFETGDHFFEYFYTRHWFNIFEIRSRAGELKGWYCNITRPASVVDGEIISEDLELDLFVSPDRERRIRLDMDEFEARDLIVAEPETYAAALAALDEIERMAREGATPFDAPLMVDVPENDGVRQLAG
jgi:protein associated with RNAse G/E